MSTATMDYTPEVVAAIANGCREFSDWQEEGQELAKVERYRQARIGDWLNAGEQQFGEKAYATAEAMFRQQHCEYTRESLRNLAYVAKAVPASLRNDIPLSWNHYVAVAAVPDPRKRELLEHAYSKRLTVRQLRELINPPAAPVASKPDDPQPPADQLFSEAEWRDLCTYAAARNMNAKELLITIIADWSAAHAEDLDEQLPN